MSDVLLAELLARSRRTLRNSKVTLQNLPSNAVSALESLLMEVSPDSKLSLFKMPPQIPQLIDILLSYIHHARESTAPRRESESGPPSLPVAEPVVREVVVAPAAAAEEPKEIEVLQTQIEALRKQLAEMEGTVEGEFLLTH